MQPLVFRMVTLNCTALNLTVTDSYFEVYGIIWR